MKVLFAGLGSIGRRHLKNLKLLCSEQGDIAQVTALRSTDRPLTSDIVRLLDREITEIDPDERYDIAFITGPTHQHAAVVAALKGKVGAFFIEKPLFDKTDIDLEEMGLGKEQKAYVAAPMRWTWLYMALRQHMNVVMPYSVRCICSSYLPGWRPEVDYRNVYSARKEMGGGVVLDLIHEWDYLIDLFGMPDKSYCISGHFSDLEIDSEDLAVYIARYPHFSLELHLDYFGRKERRNIEIFTDEGTIVADFIEGTIKMPYGNIISYKEQPNKKYLREMAYFLSYVRGHEDNNENSPQRAMQILRVAQGEPKWEPK
ncbi:Gfo/Idh/MocA family oxidoreductase [Ruminococcaceae bacterium OttesenSCG-928-I18]|nr:Gfo/Idh/MocA family oxidoreductase [Ruminococcaceae bacterium OttesenSCG-928-I18]